MTPVSLDSGSMLKPGERPLVLQVEMTSACNLACGMCPLTLGESLSSIRVGAMSEPLRNQIRSLAGGVDHILFAGFGEPLLSREFLPMLENLDAKGVTTSFSTNATRVTAEVAQRLAALTLVQNINVSVDSLDPEIYRRIRGGPLSETLDGLRNLCTAFEGRTAFRQGLDGPLPSGRSIVSVSSVAMKENLQSLMDFPPLLQSLGVNIYVLQAMSEWTPELAQAQPRHHDSPLGVFDALQRLCQEAGVGFYFGDRVRQELERPQESARRYAGGVPLSPLHTKQCTIPWELPLIDKDGKVFPCCNSASDPDSVMGDLNVENFDAIWQGARFQQFRENLLDGHRLNPVCVLCKVIPSGIHPLRQFAAEIEWGDCVLSGGGSLKLVVRNRGIVPWTPGTRVRIGTARIRDRESRFYHPTWIEPSRVASLSERVVEPGEIGTFHFAVNPVTESMEETFQLVVEDVVWLPGTSFMLRSDDLRPADAAEQTVESAPDRVAQQPAGPVISARILFSLSGFDASGRLSVIVQNTSEVTWGASSVRIGTSEPRDHASPLFFPGWLGPNRVCSFDDDLVRPGEHARFTMRLADVTEEPECFQLLVEGYSWIENTKFLVARTGQGPEILPYAEPACRASTTHRAGSVSDRPRDVSWFRDPDGSR